MAKTNKTKKKLPAQPAHQKAIIHAKRHGYKYFGFIIAVILLAATYSVAAHAQVAKAKAKPQPAWYYNGAPTASAASAGSVREHIVQLAESQIGQSEHGN